MSRADLERQNLSDFSTVINTPEGARLIAGLVDYCGVFGLSYGHDSSFKEGRRDVGLMLYSWMLSTSGGEQAYIRARDECAGIAGRGEENGSERDDY